MAKDSLVERRPRPRVTEFLKETGAKNYIGRTLPRRCEVVEGIHHLQEQFSAQDNISRIKPPAQLALVC